VRLANPKLSGIHIGSAFIRLTLDSRTSPVNVPVSRLPVRAAVALLARLIAHGAAEVYAASWHGREVGMKVSVMWDGYSRSSGLGTNRRAQLPRIRGLPPAPAVAPYIGFSHRPATLSSPPHRHPHLVYSCITNKSPAGDGVCSWIPWMHAELMLSSNIDDGIKMCMPAFRTTWCFVQWHPCGRPLQTRLTPKTRSPPI
jgi:hypothetical protein